MNKIYCIGDEEELVADMPKIINERIIAELEKLRSELHETAEMHIDGDYYLRDEWIDEYIDNRISELKGENKDNWFAEMEEAEKSYEHEKWVESLEKENK